MGRPASPYGKKLPKYPIDSVNNALRLLSLFGNRSAMRLSDVATELHVGGSTAHRLLAELEYEGYLVREELSRLYRPGPALLALGRAVAGDRDSPGYAKPIMTELAVRVGETVSLQVLRGSDVLFLDSVEAPQPLRVGSRAGAVLPAYCVSGGKALLAQLPEQRIMELFPTSRLAPVTKDSITDRKTLLAELEKVRRLGYATNFGESEPDISGVAVAVPASGGIATRALAVAAPKSRLSLRRVAEIAGALSESAALLAADLNGE